MAAPRLLLVYGAPLARPVLLSDWWENLDFMLAISDPADVPAASLANRPLLRLAYFWGADWDQYVVTGKSLAALRPEQANQYGRFYPAYGTAPPIATFDSIPGPGALIRRVAPKGLDILTRHGIPVRLAPAAAPMLVKLADVGALTGATLLAGGLAFVLRRRMLHGAGSAGRRATDGRSTVPGGLEAE